MSDDYKALAARFAAEAAAFAADYRKAVERVAEALGAWARDFARALAPLQRWIMAQHNRRHVAYIRKRRRGQAWAKTPYRFRRHWR